MRVSMLQRTGAVAVHTSLLTADSWKLPVVDLKSSGAFPSADMLVVWMGKMDEQWLRRSCVVWLAS